jgi:hypothetical protein
MTFIRFTNEQRHLEIIIKHSDYGHFLKRNHDEYCGHVNHKFRIMKKIMLLLLISASSFTQLIEAQDRDSVITLPEIKVTSLAGVNADVSNAFRRSFPDAQNLKWYQYDRDYIAKFILKDMDHNTLFRKSGMIVYDISYGYEKHVPESVRSVVNRAYDNYKIIRGIHITAQGRDIWMVKLEGMKKYLTVRVEEGELDEVESFYKAETLDE